MGKPGDALDNAIKANVLSQRRELKAATPIIATFVADKKVQVVGGVYISRRTGGALESSLPCGDEGARRRCGEWLVSPGPCTRSSKATRCAVGDLPLSRLLLANDANYPWLILVPRCAGASEIIDLDRNGQAELTREIRLVSRALKAVTPCDKLNVAALGNMVPQLHVHVIARRRSDPAWPKPIWGVCTGARLRSGAARDRLIAACAVNCGGRS